MHEQTQVKRALGTRLAEVRQHVEQGWQHGRTAIARHVCQAFGLHDAAGRPQVAGCLKALRGLEQQGQLTLPPRRRPYGGTPQPRRLEAPVPAASGVPPQVEQVQGLQLVRVDSEAHYRLWNELLCREHPRGAGPLVGRQVRYLLASAHGYLGAVGFSAAALQLRARDAWIGWEAAQRQAHLDQVVGLSRLLIRPQVECANLASKALALACAALPDDFAQRYGYRPWLLESFVDAQHELGTCYQAANWIRVGTTCGRGRNAPSQRPTGSSKDIYLYVVDPRLRDYLGLPAPVRYPPLGVEEGLEMEDWAAAELAGAPLGDARLQRRLISIVQRQASAPASPFVDTVRGDRAAVAGYYRFIDAPDDSAIDMEAILQPHRERTLRRMHSQAEVLCLHDTTDLNYATLEACTGLGVIGTNQTRTQTHGLRLHTSFAVTVEEGLPLGVVAAQCYAPSGRDPDLPKPDPRQVPIEEKETYRWITALHTCTGLTAGLEGTRVIHVMDREADFFELFDAWREGGRDALLVRARHNRRTDSGVPLFDLVAHSPVRAELIVHIPRKSPRRKKGSTAAQPARAKRRAVLSVRYSKTCLQPPEEGPNRDKAPVPVCIVHVQEERPPADGSKAIEWFLLTTLAVDTSVAAEHVFHCYTKRWRIEEWHRVLKTSCRAEAPAHRDAEGLRRVLAMNMVIAWRILLLMLLGRELPQLSPQVVFSDVEIEVLDRIARYFGWASPHCLADYMVLTARLGGYLQRKHDGPPGAEVLARGMTDLMALCLGYVLAQLE
jgi:hypothetical protein